MFNKDSKILKFSFSQNCIFDKNDSYSFEKSHNDWVLTYSGLKGFFREVKIEDYKNFNRQIFSIIESWRRKYPSKYDICDDLIWQFDIKI